MDSKGSSSSILHYGKRYLWQNGVSDLCLGWKLAEIPHHIGDFLFLDEGSLLVEEEGEALADLGLEVLFTFSLFGGGEVVIPEH
jgi:hypothetical protein